MSNLLDALLTTLCAAAGAGAAIATLYMGATPALAGVVGIAIFGMGAQLQNVYARAGDRERLRLELIGLKRADLILSDQMSQTAEQASENVNAAVNEQVMREGKLTADLKMVEALLNQLAGAMSKRIQAVEARLEETTAHTQRLQSHIQSRPTALRPAPAAAGKPAVAPVAAAPARKSKEDDARLFEAVQRALIENRADLHVQPMVSLPQRKLRFYEAFMRLRTEDGDMITPAQYLRVAEARGLMSTIDNLLLFRCVQFIRRLTARQRDVGVFCNISQHSLSDASFFPQFVDFMRAHRDLAPQIIFELPQAAYEAMGPDEDESLKELASLGFGFSMDQVHSLDFDVEKARQRGVRFVKVTPAFLLNPRTQTDSKIRLEDFSEILSRHGIALVGEKIESEKQVVDLLDFSIAYGQGFLFAEPKAMRDDEPLPVRPAGERIVTPVPAPEAAAPASNAAPATGMAALLAARPPRRVA